jgi:sugar phosphate isomerase/epimerase
MRLGIFAKTFDTLGAAATLEAVARAGYSTAQFNMASLGLPSMPDRIEADAARSIAVATESTGVSIAAVSGTYNMIHPNEAVRRSGTSRLKVLAAACGAIGTKLITLCTGTRDPEDQWRGHPDNSSPAAWCDLRAEMETAISIAERFGIFLGVEPELANVISSATVARRFLDEMASPRLKIILDPANLFEVAGSQERRSIVESAVDLLGPDLVMAHAKDRNKDGDFTAAGQGVIDFRHFVGCLTRSGFSGPLVTHGLVAADAPEVAAFLRAILREGEK